MQSLIARQSLQLHLQALRTARAGATTILRVLDLTAEGWDYTVSRMMPGMCRVICSTMKRMLTLCRPRSLLSICFKSDWIKWDDIADVGSSCPELEVLKLEVVTGTPTSPPSIPTSTPVTFLSNPIATLPRLRVFSLDRVAKRLSFDKQLEYASSETVAHILSWLFDAMPVIEDFSFGHGKISMSKKERSVFAVPTLPGIGNPSWPCTLRKLHLRELYIEPNALVSADLPALEKATLEFCGPNMIAAIQGLHRRHEHLVVGFWKHEGFGDSYSEDGGLRAVCVANRLDGKFEEFN